MGGFPASRRKFPVKPGPGPRAGPRILGPGPGAGPRFTGNFRWLTGNFWSTHRKFPVSSPEISGEIAGNFR